MKRTALHALGRWLFAFASRLAPTSIGASWHRQWEAELSFLVKKNRGPLGALQSLRIGWAATLHALYLRREEHVLRGILGELRQAARGLIRSPATSLLVVLTLAVGIASAVAVFSLAEAALLRGLPVPEGDRLAAIYSTNPSRGFSRFSVSYPDYADFAGRRDLFSSSSFYFFQGRDLSGGGEPERASVARVHRDYFQTLQSDVVLGRYFDQADHDPSSPPTAVLSEGLWDRRFGRGPEALGQAVRIDGVPHSIIGVVREGHGWPREAQLWTPFQWGTSSPPESVRARSNHTFQVIARLADGASTRGASAQIEQMAESIYSRDDIDDRDQGTSALVLPLGPSESGEEGPRLFGALGLAVFLLLAIACLNASGLLLARASSRTAEFSLRSALGAGRGRLISVRLGESLTLALVGGALGVALAMWALGELASPTFLGPTAVGNASLNRVVAAASVGISLIAALIAGVAPAIRAARTPVAEALKRGASHISLGSGGGRLRKALVVVELAMCLALLVAAGMTIRGLQHQLQTDPGFEAANLLTFAVRLPATRYSEEALVAQFYDDALAGLKRHPQIQSAAVSSRLPLGGAGMSLIRAFVLDGAPAPPEGTTYDAAWVEVSPSFFPTLGVQTTAGRPIGSDDRQEAPLVAVVNQTLAERMSGGEPILGRQIRSIYDENLPRTVIGVVPDLQYDGIAGTPEPLFIVPRAQAPRSALTFLLRTSVDPTLLIEDVRRIMNGLDGDVALEALQSLEDAHRSELSFLQFLTTLFGSFGALALLLSVSGVYGLASFSVAQRKPEMGIRLAMGASPGAVRSTLLREAGKLAAIGVALGAVIAVVLSRLIGAAVFGHFELDAMTLVGVALLLATSVFAATWFPAARASRVDPVTVLKTE